jgi:tRNA-dihydrouridine synthase B
MKLPTKNKIFLAPMEEINDIAFSLLCKKAGAGLTWTPLTSPFSKKHLDLNDRPVLQLFATETRGIKEFMKKYDKKVSAWDFNLGCPSSNAKKRGFGAYLTDLKIIEEIIKEMKANTKKPLMIKIRKCPIADDLLKLAEKYCDAIAIHPRTRAQGYSGEPDIKWAKQFKKKAKVPVIYSGNVNEKNYQKHLKTFDYIMVGRAAIGHPEIFAKLTNNKKFKRSYKDYLKLAKKFNLPFRQLKFQAMQFTKGDRDSRQLRNKIFTIKTIEDLEKFVN